MKKVKNEKKEVPATKEMNDENILNDILSGEKCISNNYSIAIDEMSNMALYKKIMDIFKDTKNAARMAFNLSFKKGWYVLEEAETKKIDEAYTKAKDQVKELS